MIRLLVIDDHDVVRQGLAAALNAHGFTSIETADSVKESRSKIAAFNPQAIIVDLNLPDGSGFEIVQWVRKLSAHTAIIVLSLNQSTQYAVLARNCGANAYISKTQSMPEIISTLKFALNNPHTFTSSIIGSDSMAVELTPREVDVLHHMAQGASNAEISSTLFISLSTVKTHISSILRKLECSNRTSAIQLAREKGLLL
jgi:DNA-binding NarL/FixJ family response regulator